MCHGNPTLELSVLGAIVGKRSLDFGVGHRAICLVAAVVSWNVAAKALGRHSDALGDFGDAELSMRR